MVLKSSWQLSVHTPKEITQWKCNLISSSRSGFRIVGLVRRSISTQITALQACWHRLVQASWLHHWWTIYNIQLILILTLLCLRLSLIWMVREQNPHWKNTWPWPKSTLNFISIVILSDCNLSWQKIWSQWSKYSVHFSTSLSVQTPDPLLLQPLLSHPLTQLPINHTWVSAHLLRSKAHRFKGRMKMCGGGHHWFKNVGFAWVYHKWLHWIVTTA